ncbi:MAG: hypothetical protein JNJ75_05865 [Cyclobacteriaceae bacterium]|nr:hypothetical protein [Cyclobacteriaceae bacterium]
MNWIFKTGDQLKFLNDGRNAELRLEQKPNFTGQVGEDVLILSKRKEWEFIAHYQISDVTVENPDDEYKKIKVTIDLKTEFAKSKPLDDYIYSLVRVTNYSSPIKHFNRKYNRVYDVEFTAILEDQIYQKRTVVGTILNALHKAHQNAFVAFLASQQPDLLTNRVDMDRLLPVLLKYLDFAVVKPAQQLLKIAEVINTTSLRQHYDEIGFGSFSETVKGSDHKSSDQMIKSQIEVINQHSKFFPGFANEIDKQLRDIVDDRKFRRLFRNSGLPITLY